MYLVWNKQKKRLLIYFTLKIACFRDHNKIFHIQRWNSCTLQQAKKLTHQKPHCSVFDISSSFSGEIYLAVTDLRTNPNYAIYYNNWARLLVLGIIPFILLVYFNTKIYKDVQVSVSLLHAATQDMEFPCKP